MWTPEILHPIHSTCHQGRIRNLCWSMQNPMSVQVLHLEPCQISIWQMAGTFVFDHLTYIKKRHRPNGQPGTDTVRNSFSALDFNKQIQPKLKSSELVHRMLSISPKDYQSTNNTSPIPAVQTANGSTCSMHFLTLAWSSSDRCSWSAGAEAFLQDPSAGVFTCKWSFKLEHQPF